jgi:hypothetical protein
MICPLPYSNALHILQSVKHACPQIQKIDLSWDADCLHCTGILVDNIDILDRYVRTMANLGHVSGGITLLHGGGLAVLGALPRLESLSIVQKEFQSYDDTQLSVPSNAFPALTNLALG